MIGIKDEYPPRGITPDRLQVQIINPDPRMENVRVELENRDLWLQFFTRGTEMILTKSGRRMFPDLKYTITGLEPDQYYFVLLDIVPADEYRYKYMVKCWLPAYKSDGPPHQQHVYSHPDSPALGAKWASMKVSFNKLKLTNNISPSASSSSTSDSLMVLNSMHRYIPRLHIFRGSDIRRLNSRDFTTFIFPETSFIAVTAYQNDDVTNLKIKFNPFAKGFREDDRKVAVKRSADATSGSEDAESPERKISREELIDPIGRSCGSVTDSPPSESSRSELLPLPSVELPRSTPLYSPYDPPLHFRNPFDPRLLASGYFRDLCYMCPTYSFNPFLTPTTPYPGHPYFPYLDPRAGQPGDAHLRL